MTAPLIIDIGTYLSKAGFAHPQDGPQMIFPTVLAQLRNPNHVGLAFCPGLLPAYVGETALHRSGILVRKFFLDPATGTIVNWNDFELYIKLMFQVELHISSQQYPLIFIVPSTWSRNDCYRLTKLFLETFEVPKLFIISSLRCTTFLAAPHPIVLPSTLSTLKTVPFCSPTCVLVHIGHTTSYLAIYHNGQNLSYFSDSQSTTLPSGASMTKCLSKMLSSNHNVFFETNREIDRLNEIKQRVSNTLSPTGALFNDSLTQLLRLSLQSLATPLETDTIEDAMKDLHILDHIYLTESLFDPLCLSKLSQTASQTFFELIPSTPLHLTIILTIQNFPFIQQELFKNVILAGGVTNMYNFAQRMEYELKSTLINQFGEDDVQNTTVQCIQQGNGAWHGVSKKFHHNPATMDLLGITCEEYMKYADDHDGQKSLMDTKFGFDFVQDNAKDKR